MNHNIELHFQQSAAWQAFQESLGRKVFHRSGEGWEYRAILEPAKFGLNRLYCPYGPFATSEHALQTALDSLRALAQSQHATYVRVQPLGVDITDTLMKKHHAERIAYSQPAHTWCIDTSRAKDDIIADMKQNNRNLYRNYAKKGLTYRRSTDSSEVSHLTHLLHGVASHNQITVHSDEYLAQQATALIEADAASLHFMEYEDEVIAAALIYEGEHTNYYAHAAADHEHRKLGASTSLLACIIIDAHDQGKTMCDLYGVTDSDEPTHRWAGFTKFKKSFGGFPVTLSETYEIPIRRSRYAGLQFLRFLRRLVR